MSCLELLSLLLLLFELSSSSSTPSSSPLRLVMVNSSVRLVPEQAVSASLSLLPKSDLEGKCLLSDLLDAVVDDPFSARHFCNGLNRDESVAVPGRNDLLDLASLSRASTRLVFGDVGVVAEIDFLAATAVVVTLVRWTVSFEVFDGGGDDSASFQTILVAGVGVVVVVASVGDLTVVVAGFIVAVVADVVKTVGVLRTTGAMTNFLLVLPPELLVLCVLQLFALLYTDTASQSA